MESQRHWPHWVHIVNQKKKIGDATTIPNRLEVKMSIGSC